MSFEKKETRTLINKFLKPNVPLILLLITLAIGATFSTLVLTIMIIYVIVMIVYYIPGFLIINNIKNEFFKEFDLLSDTIQHNPRDAKAILERGNLYMDISRGEEALVDFNTAIEIDPRCAEAYMARGNLFRDKGLHQEAMQDYDRASKFAESPHLIYLVHCNRACSYYCAQKYELAVSEFQTAIMLEPEEPYPYMDLGYVYDESGDYERALEFLRKFLELADPSEIRAVLPRTKAKIKQLEKEIKK